MNNIAVPTIILYWLYICLIKCNCLFVTKRTSLWYFILQGDFFFFHSHSTAWHQGDGNVCLNQRRNLERYLRNFINWVYSCERNKHYSSVLPGMTGGKTWNILGTRGWQDIFYQSYMSGLLSPWIKPQNCQFLNSALHLWENLQTIK